MVAIEFATFDWAIEKVILDAGAAGVRQGDWGKGTVARRRACGIQLLEVVSPRVLMELTVLVAASATHGLAEVDGRGVAASGDGPDVGAKRACMQRRW